MSDRRIRSRTISLKVLNSKFGSDELPTDHERPKTRADCVNGPRPCPYAGCRYHLYLEVHPKRGSIKLNFPDIPPDQMDRLPATCALDIADEGPYTLSEITPLLNVTSRERIRQIVEGALKQVEPQLIDLGMEPEDVFRTRPEKPGKKQE